MAKQRSVPVMVQVLRFTFKFLGKVAPPLGAKLMYRLWFSTPRYNEPSRERFMRESSTQSFLETKYGDIAIYQWGNDDENTPLVILVHGWSGRGPQLASFTEMLLDAGYKVLAFDAPGHGQSSGNATNLPIFADTLNQIASHYGQPYAIIAHSFGVMVTAYALTAHMLQARKVVCLSSPTAVSYLVDKFIDIFEIPASVSNRFRKYFERDFGTDLWTHFSADENARQLAIPALIIHDEKDEDVDWHMSEELATAWPDAEFVKTSGYGHRRILRAQDVIGMIKKFLAA